MTIKYLGCRVDLNAVVDVTSHDTIGTVAISSNLAILKKVVVVIHTVI